MRMVWAGPPSRDLEDIGDYIAKDNPAAARRVVRAIEAAARRLARFPHSGRPGHRAGPRELVVARTPYIVPYRAVSCRSQSGRNPGGLSWRAGLAQHLQPG